MMHCRKPSVAGRETARHRCNFPRWRPALILGSIEPEIAPFDPPTVNTRTKHEMNRITRCGDMAIEIRHSLYIESLSFDLAFSSANRWAKG